MAAMPCPPATGILTLHAARLSISGHTASSRACASTEMANHLNGAIATRHHPP